MSKYNTTLNSCDCPDRKFRKSKAACKHMERLIEETEYQEKVERQLFELSKQDVVNYKATLVNKYVGMWCGCYDYLEFGFPCAHLNYLTKNGLKDWSEVQVEKDLMLP